MKKVAYLFSATALVALTMLSSCKKDDPEPTQDCANQTFPSNTGSASVSILNYTNTSSGFTVIDANAGDNLSIALEIVKGTNRPQKVRIYQTDCQNAVGDIVSLSGQPGAEDGGTRLDLRNTDEAQVRQFLYTVPTGMSTIYLNIEIDESGNTYTYKRVKLNVSGSGIIDTWTGIALGGNSSTTASRLSTGTGQTYDACDAAANMEYIDITYAVNTTAPYPSYLCSNPARFLTPVGLGASTASCGEDGTLSTAGGTATYFKAHAAGDFETIDDAGLAALTVSNSNNQYIEITAINTTYEFLNSKGKKGLIRVTGGTLNNTTTNISVNVKVQR